MSEVKRYAVPIAQTAPVPARKCHRAVPASDGWFCGRDSGHAGECGNAATQPEQSGLPDVCDGLAKELADYIAQPAEAEGVTGNSRAPAEVVVDRDRMIESMCLTWRHDFGLDKPEDCGFSSGMTVAEREHLRDQMAKLVDHHFGPALSVQYQTILTLTAVNDALQAQVKALQSDANSWQAGYDKGREDGEKTSRAWKEQSTRDSAELQRLHVEVAALRAFANELVSGALCGGSFDGGDIQDAAVKHGLLSIEQREEECGAVCACSEYGFPATCYRKTALLQNNNRPVQGARDE
ncbi:MAG: hypothetical protein ITG07_02335 [Candidimonas sp.]|nr:hypothetical protein [Candidimonas sp.]